MNFDQWRRQLLKQAMINYAVYDMSFNCPECKSNTLLEMSPAKYECKWCGEEYERVRGQWIRIA